MLQKPRVSARCVSCQIGDGLPTADGKAHSYYVSRHDGRRMLVVERGVGERLRINDTTEVIILKIRPELVNLAVEYVPDDAAGSRR